MSYPGCSPSLDRQGPSLESISMVEPTTKNDGVRPDSGDDPGAKEEPTTRQSTSCPVDQALDSARDTQMLDLLRGISEKQSAILSLLQTRFDRETEDATIDETLLLPNFEDKYGRQEVATKFLHANNHHSGDFRPGGEKFAAWLRAKPGDEFPWRNDLGVRTSTGWRVLSPTHLRTEAGGVNGIMEKIWPTTWKFGQLEGYFSYHHPRFEELPSGHKYANRQIWEPQVMASPSPPEILESSAVGHLWDNYSDISSGLLGIGAVAIMLSYPLASNPQDRGDNLAFVAGHIAEWGEFDPSRCASYKKRSPPLINAPFSAEYHLRSFVGMPDPYFPSDVADSIRRSGIYCKREKLTLKSPNGKVLNLVERRYSIALRMIITEATFGAYTLFSTVDRTRGYHNDNGLYPSARIESTQERTRREEGWSRWKDFGLLTMKHQTGFAVFQLQLCNCIESWEEDWAKTLHKLDAVSSVKLADISNAQIRERLMYDSHTLERSSHYFEMLHILRIFSQVISENRSNIEDLVSRVNAHPMLFSGWPRWSNETREESQLINRVRDHNWKVIFALQEKAAERLLGKIERKTEEIKNLRDGLFSAQSVREAMKGAQISRYLFVFTTVTILFLPPTFVATFYGMDIFEKPDASQTRKQFWTVFAAVSSITYISALGAVLVVGARVKEVADWETYDGKDPEDTGLDNFGDTRRRNS
ncbi:uncharacterized protein DNG_05185 [Cephalotrichum gorgonifer]|uniref:CorA domain-containing protein n=1 Tax=Cephalotrichum gorgonifer TaxID=2041049 RepID=A0AAE8MXW7_9PEZI|nr:uncharacterized protein DNG_05185 [Cephalotrichum gorgonifer]